MSTLTAALATMSSASSRSSPLNESGVRWRRKCTRPRVTPRARSGTIITEWIMYLVTVWARAGEVLSHSISSGSPGLCRAPRSANRTRSGNVPTG